MQQLTSPAGARLSYDVSGAGPPLVLVHGAFSDHITNWEFVQPLWRQRFTVCAIARRGRGHTDATDGHRLEDEAADVAALIRSIGAPVYLLGHSYGAQVALAAALKVPTQIRKLVLYEAPWPSLVGNGALARLERWAHANDWDRFAMDFFHNVLSVPVHELEALRKTELWAPIIADAPPTLHDLRALSRYQFDARRFGALQMPVMLQIGTESPRHLYVTDALAAQLTDAQISVLPGQAHEGMTTAPTLYADAVARFLLD